jgi:hypothetical protein
VVVQDLMVLYGMSIVTYLARQHAVHESQRNMTSQRSTRALPPHKPEGAFLLTDEEEGQSEAGEGDGKAAVSIRWPVHSSTVTIARVR